MKYGDLAGLVLVAGAIYGFYAYNDRKSDDEVTQRQKIEDPKGAARMEDEAANRLFKNCLATFAREDHVQLLEVHPNPNEADPMVKHLALADAFSTTSSGHRIEFDANTGSGTRAYECYTDKAGSVVQIRPTSAQ